MKIIEIEGNGFIPGIAGQFGYQRVKLDEAGQVLEVVPFGQPFSDEQTDSLPKSGPAPQLLRKKSTKGEGV